MPIKLLTSNIKQLSSSISIVDLPANFRDAIHIARKLCVRYIWIDSLCIIQDSRLDWEIESKTMGNVYQNAILTIAAAVSERSTDGILKTYKSKVPGAVVALKLRPSSPESHIVCLSWRDELEESFGICFITDR
jgi:Heterokaryon incompatibility protein (HET)